MASPVAPSHTTSGGAIHLDPPPATSGWLPRTEADSAAVRVQLERVLASPVFSRSQRCPSFLAYVVEQTLEGHADQLKERNIGVDVFGREPDYDSNADHVVRSTAGEVRKRLAQYYLDPQHEGEIRIEVHAGSYIPEFQLPAEAVAHGVAAVEFGGRADSETTATNPRRRAQLWWFSIVVLVAASAVAALSLRARPEAVPLTALDRFWGPVLGSQSPVFVCIGNREWPIPGDQEPPDADPMNANPKLTVADAHSIRSQIVHVGDAITLSRLVGLLQTRGSQYRVQTRSTTAFSDLRRGPSILIGAQNNDWTLRLSRNLRFSFERLEDAVDTSIIRDRQDPAHDEWSVAFLRPYVELTKDYAIVSRVQDANTEQTAVIVGGIGYWGTLAAGEFLTTAAHMKKLEAYAPPDWENMNVQVVLSTDVIGGSSGPPKVLAAHFW